MCGWTRSTDVSCQLGSPYFTFCYRFEVLPAEGGDALKEELQESLMKEYNAEHAVKAQEEAKINRKALAALKIHEKQLSKPSPTQYYTSMLWL